MEGAAVWRYTPRAARASSRTVWTAALSLASIAGVTSRRTGLASAQQIGLADASLRPAGNMLRPKGPGAPAAALASRSAAMRASSAARQAPTSSSNTPLPMMREDRIALCLGSGSGYEVADDIGAHALSLLAHKRVARGPGDADVGLPGRAPRPETVTRPSCSLMNGSPIWRLPKPAGGRSRPCARSRPMIAVPP